MMTREEVAEVITYSAKRTTSPIKQDWRNLASRHGSSTTASPGMLSSRNLQKPRVSSCNCMPAAHLHLCHLLPHTSDRKAKVRREASSSHMLSIELRTPNGTMMRIQGEMCQDFIQSIIRASSGHV